MTAAPDELRPFITLPRGLAPLGYKDYLLYWVGLATTNTGRWIELTGVIWLVYELSQSPLLLGLLGAARAAPSIVLSPIAGVVADRVNLRRLLFATQGFGLLVSLGLGVLVMTGLVELWHVYLQVTVQSALTAFDAAARQALFPRLVPRAHLTKAVTLGITAARTSKLFGPAISGMVIAGLGVSAPFLLNAATFLALMAAVLAMRDLSIGRGARSSFRLELAEGLRHILAAPVLNGLFKMEIVYGFFDMNPVMIAIIGREVLGVGPQALGFLLAAPAFGSFIGIAWLLFVQQSTRQGRLSLSCTVVYALALAVFALSPSYTLSLIVLSFVGALDVLVTVTRNSIMQLAAPEGMRGRVMANLGTVTRGVGPLAETQSGIMADLIGPQPAIIAASAVLAVAAGAMAWTNRALWRFSFDDVPQKHVEPEPTHRR